MYIDKFWIFIWDNGVYRRLLLLHLLERVVSFIVEIWLLPKHQIEFSISHLTKSINHFYRRHKWYMNPTLTAKTITKLNLPPSKYDSKQPLYRMTFRDITSLPKIKRNLPLNQEVWWSLRVRRVSHSFLLFCNWHVL